MHRERFFSRWNVCECERIDEQKISCLDEWTKGVSCLAWTNGQWTKGVSCLAWTNGQWVFAGMLRTRSITNTSRTAAVTEYKFY